MRLFFSVLFVGLLTACGGTAVVESGAGGGSVASASASSTSVSSAEVASATGPASASAGPTTSGETVGSSSSGTAGCDQQGNCGDSSTGCIGCALSGFCADTYAACAEDTDCIDYSTCVSACADPACVDQCTMSHPGGAGLYNDLLQCVLCVACYVDCDGATAGCDRP